MVLVFLHRFELRIVRKTNHFNYNLNLRMIPDSPRWYIRKGMVHNAKEIILEGARINRITVPADIDYQLNLQAAALYYQIRLAYDTKKKLIFTVFF